MGKYLCHCFVNSPDTIFKEVLILAWERSWTPMLCAYFNAACFKCMLSSSATSCIIWETRTLLLTVLMSVGKKACLVIKSKKTFAVFTAVGLQTEWANAYLEKTPVAVMMFSQPPRGGKSGNRSICSRSSSLRPHSGMWIISGVVRVLFMRLV